MVFKDAVTVYLSAKAVDGIHFPRDRGVLCRLFDRFGAVSVFDIKRHHVRRYVADRVSCGIKVSTVRRELRIPSAALNFVRLEYGLEFSNPFGGLGLKPDVTRVRWITREEATGLMAAAERCAPYGRPHLPAFIRLALNTGCRRGELLELEWSRVNERARYVLFEPHQNKSRRRRVVPLNDDALSALDRLRSWQSDNAPGSRWVFGWRGSRRLTTFRAPWVAALAMAGITDFRVHDLRHTFASWLVQQGESLYTVRDLLGHASVKQTEVYAHLAPDQGLGAVQRLLPF